MKILCLTDFSEYSYQAIIHTLKIYGTEGKQYCFMHASGITESNKPEEEEYQKHYLKNLELQMAELLSRVESELSPVESNSYQIELKIQNESYLECVTIFTKDYDLVVTGAIGSTSNGIIGHNAIRVMENAKTAVLVVPHDKIETTVKDVLYFTDKNPDEELVQNIYKLQELLDQQSETIHLFKRNYTQWSSMKFRKIDWHISGHGLIFELPQPIKEKIKDADLIVADFEHHELIYQLFYESTFESILEYYRKLPVLIISGKKE